MNTSQLRWGILGAAEIARKNWKAIQLSGNSIVTAVASRDLQRARSFIELCQKDAPFSALPQAVAHYEEVLASPNVDAVYIPLPTGVRKQWVLRAAAAGKHVVCEKPCAVTVPDLEEMLEACRQHNVQFMDGVMFMHSRRLAKMEHVLADGQSVGSIRHITSAFSFRGGPEFATKNIRAHSELEPLGCLGDLGWYNIRFSLWARKWQLPQTATGRILTEMKSPQGSVSAIGEFSGSLLYDDGVSAEFYCSFVTGLEQWAIVSGTEGYLQVPDFVLPFTGAEMNFEVVRSSYHVHGCDFRMDPGNQNHTLAEHSHGTADAQEANLFRNFAATVLAGKRNPLWPDVALKTQRVMAACLASARSGGSAVKV